MRVMSLTSCIYVLLLFVVIVIPNSLQAFSFVLLALGGVLGAKARVSKAMMPLFLFYAGSLVVTCVYLVVGVMNGAPVEAVGQVLIIYIVSPILWLLFSNGAIAKFHDQKLINLIVWATVAAMVSVGVFFFLYLIGGAGAVSFFREGANLNLKDGYAGATLHVYGPLMFMTAGFFAVPQLISSPIVRLIVLGGLMVTAVTSGRTALLLAVAVGLSVGMGLQLRRGRGQRTGLLSPRRLITGLLSLVAVGVSLFLLERFTEIKVSTIATIHIEELFSGGGYARTEQAAALLEGARESNGLGVGHGVGVDYNRSFKFPWRYELVWHASLLRVGLLGALVYVSVFVYYVLSFLRAWLRREVSDAQAFFFAGFAAALVASNTNPYLESFSMQWMFILPVVHFLVSSRHSLSSTADGRRAGSWR